MEDNLFLFPITGWEIKALPIDGIVSLRFPFLSHEQQKLAEADPGRPYVMRTEQARELRDALSRAIARIDNAEAEHSSSETLSNGCRTIDLAAKSARFRATIDRTSKYCNDKSRHSGLDPESSPNEQ